MWWCSTREKHEIQRCVWFSGLIYVKLNSGYVCLVVLQTLLCSYIMFLFAHIWTQAHVQYLFASLILCGSHAVFLPSCPLKEHRECTGIFSVLAWLSLSCPLSFFSAVDAFCQTLVDTLEGTPGLRYIWSTFKPLLQGKVLYAPDTPAARLIVKEVSLERKMYCI